MNALSLNLSSDQARKFDSGCVAGMPRNAVLITPLRLHVPSIRWAFADPSWLFSGHLRFGRERWGPTIPMWPYA
jgi:hypothetical protein